jgi:hypothetical protein
MSKYRVEIVTQSDLIKFVSIAEALDDNVTLKILSKDGSFACNGKSLLGVRHAMEWDSMYIESNVDLYTKFAKFIID